MAQTGTVGRLVHRRAGRDSSGPQVHARVTSALRLCSATSFVGLPAVAVPAGVFGGLPQGVQVIGAAFREDLCLDAAAAIARRYALPTPVEPAVAAAQPAPAG